MGGSLRGEERCDAESLNIWFDAEHVSEPYLNVLEAIAEHPLSTRQGLRDAGTPIDESALREAIRRGLVEIHVTAVTAIGEEERFTLTRAGLLASGRDPDAASLLAELDQLERQERDISLFGKRLHARLAVSPDSTMEARERRFRLSGRYSIAAWTTCVASSEQQATTWPTPDRQRPISLHLWLPPICSRRSHRRLSTICCRRGRCRRSRSRCTFRSSASASRFRRCSLFAEWRYLRTGDELYRTLARRWTRVMAALFAAGVVTGTILSFEMGLLWPGFTGTFGGVFGLGFAVEGFSFFLEAIFIGIYIYGWRPALPARRISGAVSRSSSPASPAR